MQLIPDLLNSSIQNAELNNHGSNVIKVIEDANVADDTLIELKDALAVDNEQLTLALNQDRQNEFTVTLRTLDDLRDDGFKCLKRHVLADTTLLNVAIANSAKAVYRIIKNHGLMLYRDSYEKESALLESLFKDLDEVPMQQELVTLGITTVYEELKQAQSNFNDTYVSRSITAPNKDLLIAASRAHKPVKHSLELLTQYINVMVNRKKAPFEALAVAIGDLVDNINQKIRTRESGKSDKGNEPDSPTEI